MLNVGEFVPSIFHDHISSHRIFSTLYILFAIVTLVTSAFIDSTNRKNNVVLLVVILTFLSLSFYNETYVK